MIKARHQDNIVFHVFVKMYQPPFQFRCETARERPAPNANVESQFHLIVVVNTITRQYPVDDKKKKQGIVVPVICAFIVFQRIASYEILY